MRSREVPLSSKRWKVVERNSEVVIHDEDSKWIATARNSAVATVIVIDHNQTVANDDSPNTQQLLKSMIRWK